MTPPTTFPCIIIPEALPGKKERFTSLSFATSLRQLVLIVFSILMNKFFPSSFYNFTKVSALFETSMELSPLLSSSTMSKPLSLSKTLLKFSKFLVQVCLYTSEWPISSLSRHCDPHPNLYPPPHEDPTLIRDALFHTRTEPKYRKIKGEDVVLDPFQMINTELKDKFKKWSTIISENAISLTGHKDHPNCSIVSPLANTSILLTISLIE
ncbi:hypothetical protein Tco_1333944 [Tanacetum coccineum]